MCAVCACMCVLCVRDMYIQRHRHAPGHTPLHIRIQMPMYVEVWNIMTFKLDVPDPVMGQIVKVGQKRERERAWGIVREFPHM